MSFCNDINKILIRLKSGEDCFEKLYNLTYKHLLVIAKLYLKDKSLAQDVLSDAYVAVYKNIASFNEDKNGYNWLCKIVQNKAYNFNNDTFYHEPLENITIQDNYIFDNNILNCDIGLALDKLEKEERELIVMRFFLNKTLAEIGQEKQVSTVAVHKKIKKILKKLQKLI